MKKIPLLFLLLFLVSCSSPSVQPTPTPQAFALSGGPSALQVLVASDDFPVGQPRVPLLLFAGPQRVADARQLQLVAFDLSRGTPEPGWTGEATNYSDYAVPYWVAYPALPHAGLWGLQATITQADGTVTTGQLVIEVKDSTSVPAIGSQPPRSQNRTLTTQPDLRQLTSAAQPNPAFYQMTIAEAMQSGQPSVVVFATPGFCLSTTITFGHRIASQ